MFLHTLQCFCIRVYTKFASYTLIRERHFYLKQQIKTHTLTNVKKHIYLNVHFPERIWQTLCSITFVSHATFPKRRVKLVNFNSSQTDGPVCWLSTPKCYASGAIKKRSGKFFYTEISALECRSFS